MSGIAHQYTSRFGCGKTKKKSIKQQWLVLQHFGLMGVIIQEYKCKKVYGHMLDINQLKPSNKID